MFFKMLSAMVAADALNRRQREQQHRRWLEEQRFAAAPWAVRPPLPVQPTGAGVGRRRLVGARTTALSSPGPDKGGASCWPGRSLRADDARPRRQRPGRRTAQHLRRPGLASAAPAATRRHLRRHARAESTREAPRSSRSRATPRLSYLAPAVLAIVAAVSLLAVTRAHRADRGREGPAHRDLPHIRTPSPAAPEGAACPPSPRDQRARGRDRSRAATRRERPKAPTASRRSAPPAAAPAATATPLPQPVIPPADARPCRRRGRRRSRPLRRPSSCDPTGGPGMALDPRPRPTVLRVAISAALLAVLMVYLAVPDIAGAALQARPAASRAAAEFARFVQFINRVADYDPDRRGVQRAGAGVGRDPLPGGRRARAACSASSRSGSASCCCRSRSPPDDPPPRVDHRARGWSRCWSCRRARRRRSGCPVSPIRLTSGCRTRWS